MIDFLSSLLVAGGLVFFTAGTVGILRFPDIYTRLHALTKADNLGLGLVVAGLALRAPHAAYLVKLILIWVLVLIASATACYLLAQRAWAHENRERDR